MWGGQSEATKQHDGGAIPSEEDDYEGMKEERGPMNPIEDTEKIMTQKGRRKLQYN